MGLERLLCSAPTFYSRLLPPFRNTAVSAYCHSFSSFFGARCKTTLNTKCQLVVRHRFCTSAQTTKEVILFEHDKTNFFRLVAFFCGGQFIFWTFMAEFAYSELRDTSRNQGDHNTPILSRTFIPDLNLGSSAWRYSFTLGCLTLAAGAIGLGVMFCRRSVFKVILHRGGKRVTFLTQSPLGPGRGRKVTVPLSDVGCYTHRDQSSSFIPIKIKGHRMYYLLDTEGTIKNTRLFDVTVGAYRSF